MYNILICDDERDIVNALKIYLKNPEYRILEAYDGVAALDAVRRGDIHLILMDVMMPKMDGITAMAEIRRLTNVPIILLTAKSEDGDIISGLNAGADDYITKPFKPGEVIARVKSQLRRYTSLGGSKAPDGQLCCGGITLNLELKSVTLDGETLSLTPTEYDILKLFLENPGRVFSPREIYSKVWNDSPIGCENTIAVHIRHLREKTEIDPAHPRYITVVWGQGYRLES